MSEQTLRIRTDEEITDALRRMCDTVWGHGATVRPAFWHIPANTDTDVDCILYDAFRELKHLRALNAPAHPLPPDVEEVLRRAEAQATELDQLTRPGNFTSTLIRDLSTSLRSALARAEQAEREREAWRQSHDLNAERMLAAERQAAILRAEVDSDTELLLTKDLEVVRMVVLLNEVCGSALDAMLTWPAGSNGPIAIAAYESLVRRLAFARSALASSDSGEGKP